MAHTYGPHRRRQLGVFPASRRTEEVLLRLRVAEASSSELGHRSRALVEQLRSTVKTHEIEAVERNVAIAVKNNKLFANKRPAEFIRRSADSPPLRRVI